MVVGEIYHIFTRSIADFRIFNDGSEFQRMQQLIKYYSVNNEAPFSDFVVREIIGQYGFDNAFATIAKDKEKLVQIIAYCLMPTHLHLIVKMLSEKGISKYINKILNSYTRFFNEKHRRRGPLWESRFKSVLVKTDEQLLHLTRYLHLNPTTAKLVNHPKDWDFSSYKEYISKENKAASICQFSEMLDIRPTSYRKFVNDRIGYQRELAKIKSLVMD